MSTLIAGAAKWLGPILLEAGADYLKDMISGDGGGDLAGGVIEQIAGKLGVPAEQKPIEDAFAKRPTDVIQAVQEVDTFWADIEKSRSASMQSQHRLAEAELGAGLLARIGRPLNTILFAIECLCLMLAVCWVVMRGIPASLDFNQVAPLLALVVPVLTAQAGVIGWDARQQRLVAKDAAS